SGEQHPGRSDARPSTRTRTRTRACYRPEVAVIRPGRWSPPAGALRDLHDLVARGLALHDRDLTLLHVEVLGEGLDQGLVRLAVDRGCGDVDLEPPRLLADERLLRVGDDLHVV